MKKILIIQNKRIGDVLISSVIANNFKQKYPTSFVHFMCYDFTTGVLENNPNIDKIIAVKEKELKKLKNLYQFIKQIRAEKYDIIFDPYSKTQSRIICKFSGATKTVGHKSRKKFSDFGYYTHPVELLKHKTNICGKAIEDRIHLLTTVEPFETIDYEPHLFLTESEKNTTFFKITTQKTIVLSILGSTPQKSMPYEYVAKISDYLIENYQVRLIFNYAPNQKKEAEKIFNLCVHQKNILIDVYAHSIRDFVVLMNQCDALIGNEGGSVHIAKALQKPTFTIFSPYVNKDHWASFEDGIFHQSVHLIEEKPELYSEFTFKNRKKIEEDPSEMYAQLTPEMIIPKINHFMSCNL